MFSGEFLMLFFYFFRFLKKTYCHTCSTKERRTLYPTFSGHPYVGVLSPLFLCEPPSEGREKVEGNFHYWGIFGFLKYLARGRKGRGKGGGKGRRASALVKTSRSSPIKKLKHRSGVPAASAPFSRPPTTASTTQFGHRTLARTAC